jgi:hypothetical protein
MVRQADPTLDADRLGPFNDLTGLFLASRPDRVVEMRREQPPAVFISQRPNEMQESNGIGTARDGQEDAASRRKEIWTAGEVLREAIEKRGRSRLLLF